MMTTRTRSRFCGACAFFLGAALALAPAAQADPWDHGGGYGGYDGHGYGHDHGGWDHGDWHHHWHGGYYPPPVYGYPPPVYYAPPPVYYAPPVVTFGIQP